MTQTFNAAAAIEKDQPVRKSGGFTTIGMATVEPCAADAADVLGIAQSAAKPGENISVEVAEKTKTNAPTGAKQER